VKSIICMEPYKLRMIEEEIPVRNENEALVKIRRIGICGTDLHAYRGNQPFFEYPRILGHELSGEIMEIGDNKKDLKVGDRVSIIPYIECGECMPCRLGKTNCCVNLTLFGVHRDGGMREYLCVPHDHLLCTNEISLDQAAIIECLAIGAHAVKRAEVKKNDNVLVLGAGPIGLGVMKYAKLKGANVIAVDINENRLEFCKRWGTIDYTLNVNQDLPEEISRITSGDMASIVFDVTGNAKSMENAMKFVAHGGKLVFVGLVKDKISFYDPDFHKKEMTLLSSRNAQLDDFQYVLHSIREGYVDTESFITHRTDFDNVITKYENWLKPDGGVIKALVEING